MGTEVIVEYSLADIETHKKQFLTAQKGKDAILIHKIIVPIAESYKCTLMMQVDTFFSDASFVERVFDFFSETTDFKGNLKKTGNYNYEVDFFSANKHCREIDMFFHMLYNLLGGAVKVLNE